MESDIINCLRSVYDSVKGQTPPLPLSVDLVVMAHPNETYNEFKSKMMHIPNAWGPCTGQQMYYIVSLIEPEDMIDVVWKFSLTHNIDCVKLKPLMLRSGYWDLRIYISEANDGSTNIDSDTIEIIQKILTETIQ